ncbi:MAG: HTH domain-containing protein [Erysipelotrichaceae bacterium]|nr:HTH domain-containing protein [Erysipelotrichaceae bacterium]
MYIFDVKQYYIIYLLLNSTEKKPLTSNRLASELSLSNKTIQVSISNISEFCLKNGFEIISKSGNGFYVNIIDPEKTLILKQNLDIYFSKNYITGDKNALLQANIMLYLMNKNEPVTIEEICQLFYLSKSTVYSYMDWFEAVFNRSDIELHVGRKQGISKVGKEANIRLFTAFNLGNNIFQYDFDLIYGEDFHFLKNSSLKAIRIIELFEKHGLVLGDNKHNVFLAYVAYSEYRFKRYYKLEFDEKKKEMIRPLKEWALAEEIVNELNLEIKSDDNEIAAITSLILTFNDSYISLTPNRYGEFFYREINNLYFYLNTYLKSLSPELCHIDGFKDQLTHLSYRIYFLRYFNFYTKSLSAIELNNLQTPNAMSRYLARLIAAQITNYFGERLEHKFADYICSFCHNLLYSVELTARKCSILLILKDGKRYNEHVYTWLDKHLEPRPTSINQMTLYEANVKDLSSYNLILTDYRAITSIQGKYKVYHICAPIDENCSFLNEYYKIAHCRNISPAYIERLFDYIYVNPNRSITNTVDFLTQLDNDLDGFGNIPIREIRKLGRPINYYSDNKLLVIPYLYKGRNGNHKNILSIYFNENPKSKYSTLIFFSIYSDFSLDSLLVLRNICNELLINPNIIKKISSKQ